jgi:hypothetical protein
MDELKPGDRVRITYEHDHTGDEGVFTGMERLQFLITLDTGEKTRWSCRSSFEIIKPATPPRIDTDLIGPFVCIFDDIRALSNPPIGITKESSDAYWSSCGLTSRGERWLPNRGPLPAIDPTPGWTAQQAAKRQQRLDNILLGREIRQQRGLLLRVPSGVVHKHWSEIIKPRPSYHILGRKGV